MTDRENLLRAYRFQTPERIPVHVGIGPAMWRLYGRPLQDVVLLLLWKEAGTWWGSMVIECITD